MQQRFNRTQTDAFSDALIRAHQSGARGDPSTLAVPDYAEALGIQRRVMGQLGPVGGFKVARFREGQPCMAPIPDRRTVPTGANVTTRDRMGIELEIGFELLRAPDAGMTTGDMAARPASFFRPRVVLELVDQRLTGKT